MTTKAAKTTVKPKASTIHLAIAQALVVGMGLISYFQPAIAHANGTLEIAGPTIAGALSAFIAVMHFLFPGETAAIVADAGTTATAAIEDIAKVAPGNPQLDSVLAKLTAIVNTVENNAVTTPATTTVPPAPSA